MIEHRRGRRIDTNHFADLFVSEHCSVKTVVRNVSADGVFVSCPPEVAGGTYVRVQFSLPNSTRSSLFQFFQLSGLVVHRCEAGIGVLVNDAKPDSVAALNALLAHYSDLENESSSPWWPGAADQVNV